MNILAKKSYTSIVSLFLLAFTLFSSQVVIAGHSCQRFTLTSNIMLLGPNGPAVGTAQVTLESGATVEVSAEGEIIHQRVNKKGVIHMRVKEVDDWGALGTTLGFDRLKLAPTDIPGEYDLKIKTFIIGESGDLADVYGRYRGMGSVSFNTGILTHSGSGRVCNLPF